MKGSVKLIILLGAWMLSGCDDQLELGPESQLSEANFYKTPQDIEQAALAAYDALQSTGEYGLNFSYFMEVRSDNSFSRSITTSGGIYGDVELFRVVPTNALLSQTWQDCYRGIQRCNIVLSRINDIAMGEQLKANRIGEMKFLRALTYFNMVRIWGDVPLVLNETKDAFEYFALSRSPASNVYEQVKTDLNEALALLPAGQNSEGRATKASAQALLAKVHLTLKEYQEAYTLLKEIIDTDTYQLVQNFSELFDPETENNAEIIFSVQFEAGNEGEGSAFSNYFAIDNTLIGGVGVAAGDNVPTPDLYNLYADPDLRKSITIGKLPDGRIYCSKYLGVPELPNSADNNFIVLRYADVLLMAAEALNELAFVADGEAFQYLNEIRSRAGIPLLTSADLPDQESFRMAVAFERRLELAFENHRWFDLVRTNLALDVMNNHTLLTGVKVNIDDHHLYYPIPQREIDASGGVITQNLGY